MGYRSRALPEPQSARWKCLSEYTCWQSNTAIAVGQAPVVGGRVPAASLACGRLDVCLLVKGDDEIGLKFESMSVVR